MDANQGAVVSALRAAGVKVAILSHVGGGVPDLLCTYHGRVTLLEVKDGGKPPSARRLTPDELEFAREHPVAVVTNVREALAAVGIEVAA